MNRTIETLARAALLLVVVALPGVAPGQDDAKAVSEKPPVAAPAPVTSATTSWSAPAPALVPKSSPPAAGAPPVAAVPGPPPTFFAPPTLEPAPAVPPTWVPGPNVPVPTHVAPGPPVVMSGPAVPFMPARAVTLDAVAVLLVGGEDGAVVAAEGKPARLAEVAKRLLASARESEGPLDAPAVLKEIGVLEHTDLLWGIRLSTVDNVEAKANSMDRVAHVAGATVSMGRPGGPDQPGGRTTLFNQVQTRDLGILIRATPRIGPDELIVVKLGFEASLFGPEKEGVPVAIAAGGETVRTPAIHSITVETTVAGRDGQTIVAQQSIRKDGPKTKLLLILLRPHAEPPVAQ